MNAEHGARPVEDGVPGRGDAHGVVGGARAKGASLADCFGVQVVDSENAWPAGLTQVRRRRECVSGACFYEFNEHFKRFRAPKQILNSVAARLMMVAN